MTSPLTTVRVVGGLLPTDVIAAVLGSKLDGLGSSDYHLGGESPREAAARIWTHLLGVYRRFRDDLARLPEGDAAVGVTRERWLMVLLSELGYGRVPLTPAGGLAVGDKTYPVSHLWGATPIHLLGWGVPLDKRSPGVAGAALRAPHAMLQEELNRADEHLWAILANGRVLRLLRDSTTLTGQSYVEFDLEAMFDGEVFSDFVALFLLCHESRVEVPEGGAPADCRLEQWRTTAVSQGVRALSLLRDGVQRALEVLGTGFLQHPANADLRDNLASGAIRLDDLHQSLLRTVYRLLFWAVAEDRGALLDPATDAFVLDRYRSHFSSARLRSLAVRRHGSAHDDLWQGVDLVLAALGRAGGEPRLGLPGLGGLFAVTEADVLAGCRLPNARLLSVVRDVSVVQPKGQARRHVDFRNLGAEELGSIYESLLELVPRYDPSTHVFSLQMLAGNDRKTSGSYYTPTALVELVLDTALDPVLDVAEKQENPEQALLALKVCDPAMGSGHFIVAAARRIATRVATQRTGEIDPTPTTLADAMHDVVARCIYGVDLNPMAADLAKVSLWLEAMSPGRPLSFLDHHIKVGNALLGTTPALLHAGIPDSAFVALTGDDKPTVKAWKKLNEFERSGQGSFFDDGGLDLGNAALRKGTNEVAVRAESAQTLADIAWAAQRYNDATHSDEAVRRRRTADAWCAAFLSPKVPGAPPITEGVVSQISRGTAPGDVSAAVDALGTRHRLFHWHLEFPGVFAVPEDGIANSPNGWTGGFDAMLGNPPWERVKLQEQEYFATKAPEIANAKNAAFRKRAIDNLKESRPTMFKQFNAAKRVSEAESQFLRGSGRYPFCGVGDVNTYSVFAEHFRSCLSLSGRSGIITPTGLATDATTAAFFSDSLRSQRLSAFHDFDNEGKIFANVHHALRFAISCMTGGEKIPEVRLSFLNRNVSEVFARGFTLSGAEVLALNPNSGTLSLFRSRRDATIALLCYGRHPILIQNGVQEGNRWNLSFSTLFHMANDSSGFKDASEFESEESVFDGWSWVHDSQRWLPLYEGKLLNIYDSRFSTYAGATDAQLRMQTLPRLNLADHMNPTVEPRARYWVAEEEVRGRIPSSWKAQWFLGWRDMTNASVVRTFIPSVLPFAGVNHKFPLALPADPSQSVPLLQATWSSLIFDYLAAHPNRGCNSGLNPPVSSRLRAM